MTRRTIVRRKRPVTCWIKKILLRAAVRVMAGDARIQAWLDALVGYDKKVVLDLMTSSTELSG